MEIKGWKMEIAIVALHKVNNKSDDCLSTITYQPEG